MKKLLTLVLALALTLSLAACGEKPAPAPAAPAPEAPAADTAAPAEDAAEDEQLEFELDYDAIASWVDSGFIGTDASGAPVVLALDATASQAIIIFGNNDDMTAASVVGPITIDEANSGATITDEVNGLALTFGMLKTDDSTIELDMGDLGTATISIAPTEDVLAAIDGAIANYTMLA
ncbi:MAG: hypothetical protein RRY95_08560 [Oscillospiraceae bacterium]